MQAVIDPRETQKCLISLLAVHRTRHGSEVGEHHLSNWPTVTHAATSCGGRKICPEFLGRARVLPVNSVYLGARIAIVTRAW